MKSVFQKRLIILFFIAILFLGVLVLTSCDGGTEFSEIPPMGTSSPSVEPSASMSSPVQLPEDDFGLTETPTPTETGAPEIDPDISDAPTASSAGSASQSAKPTATATHSSTPQTAKPTASATQSSTPQTAKPTASATQSSTPQTAKPTASATQTPKPGVTVLPDGTIILPGLPV